MRKVLITGSSGFIGRTLRDYIEKRYPEIEVYGVDTKGTGRKKGFFKVDINNTQAIKNIIEKTRPDHIFHLAGLTRSGDFQSLVTSNVINTGLFLEAIFQLRELCNSRVIVIGSAAEYGNILAKDMPVKESHALNPVNFYGLSKKYQTELALSYFRKSIDVIVARIFNITGYGSPRSLSCGEFSYQLSLIERNKARPFMEVRDLTSKRDYVDIKDVCSALVALAENGKRGEVYNVCSSEAYSTRHILNFLIRISGLKGVKVKTSSRVSSEIRSIRGSNDKIRRHTGWKPLVSIEESLKETFNYYRKA